jgi:hypothetical protein
MLKQNFSYNTDLSSFKENVSETGSVSILKQKARTLFCEVGCYANIVLEISLFCRIKFNIIWCKR